MKPKILLQHVMALCLLHSSAALAQFSSGSTGADGSLFVTSNTTLNLPADGVFNFTTINVSGGVTLNFNRNPLNTPVYLLATSNVVISGTISVDAYSDRRAGPGGFDGGFTGFQGFGPGDGQGPGGGRSTAGFFGAAHAFTAQSNTNVYGNTLLSPLIGGSGGAAAYSAGFTPPNRPGGGGGGAILIASSTRVTVNGTASARGADSGGGGSGGGSGGAVRVVAPVIDGNGQLAAVRGTGLEGNNHGSDGRTRIDCTDRLSHKNITLGGKGTRGNQMFVFPPGNLHLDIIRAAGMEIPEGTNQAVTVTLPVGASSNQVIRVQARGFTNDIPFRVRVTPENAPSATFDGIITNTGNPSVGEVTVSLPVDIVTYIQAWTR